MPAYSRILLPWDSQPQEVVGIDWQHALSRGLLIALLPHTLINLVDGLPIEQRSGTTVGILRTEMAVTEGALMLPNPANASDSLARFDLAFGTALTVAIQPTETNNGSAFLRGNGSSDPTWAIGLHGGSFDGVYARWGTFVAAGSSGGPVPTIRRVAVVTADGATARAYIDGAEVASGSYTPVSSQYAAPSDLRRVVMGSISGTGFDIGTCPFLGLLWNRPLSAAEVAEISQNPWQLFEPRQIWIPVSAAGGGATVNGNIGIAVASGLSGSVNANRTIAGSLGTAIASGLQGAVHTNTTIAGSLGIASASGLAAAVGANRAITGSLGIAAASGFTGTVSNSSDTTIAGALGTATASGFAGIVNANTTVAGGMGTAVASGLQGAVSNTNDIVIGGTLGIAIASGLLGNVNANHTIASNLGTAVASGLTGTVSNGTSATLDLILKILRNRQELNPATGTFTLYDNDGTTVLYTTSAWADAAGTVPYSGGALRRIDALF